MRRVKGIFALFTLALTGCQAPSLPVEEVFTRTQVLMGDVAVTIQLVAPPSLRAEALAAMGRAFDLARLIETEVSEYVPSSQTSRLNQAPPDRPVPIGTHLRHLLVRSRQLSEATEAYFDITYASKDPSSSFRDVQLSDDGVKARIKNGKTQIALSGIAKGYIVDQMAQQLQKGAWQDFTINAGGDILVRGSQPVGPWPITLHRNENDGSALT